MKSETKRNKDIENPEEAQESKYENFEVKPSPVLTSSRKQTPAAKIKILE